MYGTVNWNQGEEKHNHNFRKLIISENPELIILPGKNEKYSELLKSRSGWSYINAVKENNIILLQKDIASRWGPRILDFVNILAEYSNNWL